jgi:hypothetical protein
MPDNKPYITKLYVSSILMVVIPAIVFMASKHIILPLFGLHDVQRRTLFAGIAAIIVVKALSTAYLISAFKEGDQERKLQKQQDEWIENKANEMAQTKKNQ